MNARPIDRRHSPAFVLVTSRLWSIAAALPLLGVTIGLVDLGGFATIGWVLAFTLRGMVSGGTERRRVIAGIETDTEGRPKVFTLELGSERIPLEPGRPCTPIDHFQWAPRRRL